MSASTSGAFAARPESIWLMRGSSSLRQRGDVPLARAGVFRQWTDQPIVRLLFHDVRGPTGDARHDEKRREHIDIKTQHVIGGAGREIEIGMNLLLLEHHGFEN